MSENPYASPTASQIGSKLPAGPLGQQELRKMVGKESMRIGSRSAIPTAILIILIFPLAEFFASPYALQWYHPLIAILLLFWVALMGLGLGAGFGSLGGALVGSVLTLLLRFRLTQASFWIYLSTIVLCPLWGGGVALLYAYVMSLDRNEAQPAWFTQTEIIAIAIGMFGGLIGSIRLAHRASELVRASRLPLLPDRAQDSTRTP